MRVTFLGTGSAMPTGERYQTGLLVTDDDRQLLVDCGSGVLHRLAATPGSYEAVDAVLLTHHHLDHIADVMPFLKARWLSGADTIEIAGPPGTESLLDALFNVHDYMQDRLDLTVRDLKPSSFTIAGFDAKAMETRHSILCYAYRFAGETGDFVFSGDSEAFDALAAFADDAAVLAHDCSFPDEVDVSNHPTPAKLGAVLAGHTIDTVYLTHLYPHTNGKHQEMLDSLGNHYDGHVEFAHDGLTITV